MPAKTSVLGLLLLSCLLSLGCSAFPKHAQSKPDSPSTAEETDPDTKRFNELQRDLSLYSD